MSVDTPQIVQSAKLISGAPVWVQDSDYFQLVASLEWRDGVTIEGAALRVRARRDMRDRCVTIQMEYPQEGRTDRAIYRIDWKPIHSHKNGMVGPEKSLHGLVIVGSHVHAFEYNWVSNKERLLCYNLPVAAPMEPEPQTYDELLKVAAMLLGIGNLNPHVVPHPWEKLEPDLFQ